MSFITVTKNKDGFFTVNQFDLRKDAVKSLTSEGLVAKITDITETGIKVKSVVQRKTSTKKEK